MSTVDRPRVVLCAGLGLSSRCWSRVVAELAGEYTVRYVDRPGLDGTMPARRPTTLAAEVDRVVRAAGERPAILIGHSMAGFFVEAAARTRPDTIRGLVLVDPSVEEALRRGSRRRTRVRVVAAGWFLRAGRLRPLCRRLGTALLEDAAYPNLAHDLEAVRGRAALPDVPIRLLVANRTTDAPWDRRWVRRQRGLAGRLAADHPRGARGITVEVVRPAGHRLMADRPDRVAAAIRAVAGPVVGPG